MISGIFGAVGIGLFVLSVAIFISPFKGTFFKNQVSGLLPLGASLVFFYVAGATSPMPIIAPALPKGRPVAPGADSETLQVGPTEVYAMNLNTQTVIVSGMDHPLPAQQMGRAISIVAERIRSGEVKLTKETQWAQFKFLIQHGDDSASQLSVGSLRVPIERLKAAPPPPGLDARPFLDLVDHTERGPDFDAIEAFCRGKMEPDRGQKFCAVVASGK